MPSEKAKGNKALVATCVACQKSLSIEVMVSLTGRDDGRPKQFSLHPVRQRRLAPPGLQRRLHVPRVIRAAGARALQRSRNASQPLKNYPRLTGAGKEKDPISAGLILRNPRAQSGL
jgi:hypothetical protein